MNLVYTVPMVHCLYISLCMHLLKSPKYDGFMWYIGNTICHRPMLTFGFKQQWCSLYGPPTNRENFWNCSCQKLLAQFWNILIVCLIYSDSLKHRCQGCFHISLLFLGWSPFKFMPRFGLYSVHNFVARQISQNRNTKCFFGNYWCIVNFAEMFLLRSSNKCAQAGANPLKTNVELGLVFFQCYSPIKIFSCPKNITCYQYNLANVPLFDPQ